MQEIVNCSRYNIGRVEGDKSCVKIVPFSESSGVASPVSENVAFLAAFLEEPC